MNYKRMNSAIQGTPIDTLEILMIMNLFFLFEELN